MSWAPGTKTQPVRGWSGDARACQTARKHTSANQLLIMTRSSIYRCAPGLFVWGWLFLDRLQQDLRYVLRGMRKSLLRYRPCNKIPLPVSKLQQFLQAQGLRSGRPESGTNIREYRVSYSSERRGNQTKPRHRAGF